MIANPSCCQHQNESYDEGEYAKTNPPAHEENYDPDSHTDAAENAEEFLIVGHFPTSPLPAAERASSP